MQKDKMREKKKANVKKRSKLKASVVGKPPLSCNQKKTLAVQGEAPMLIEVKLPNGMRFSTSFKLTCFLSLLKDLGYAMPVTNL